MRIYEVLYRRDRTVQQQYGVATREGHHQLGAVRRSHIVVEPQPKKNSSRSTFSRLLDIAMALNSEPRRMSFDFT